MPRNELNRKILKLKKYSQIYRGTKIPEILAIKVFSGLTAIGIS